MHWRYRRVNIFTEAPACPYYQECDYFITLGFILFAAWGKKRDVVIVKPDNFNENGNVNITGADDDVDDESSRDSNQERGSQRSEIAQVETKG